MRAASHNLAGLLGVVDIEYGLHHLHGALVPGLLPGGLPGGLLPVQVLTVQHLIAGLQNDNKSNINIQSLVAAKFPKA